MRFEEVVLTSERVAETARRLQKVDLLAGMLKQLEPPEVPVALAYLSGFLPQGRIGVGWSLVSQAKTGEAASEPALALLEVHDALGHLARAAGPGSAGQKVEVLRRLFARATASEQSFLVRLLLGDLRQGALEGVMLEAVARAAGVAAARVRRATMASGDLALVAQAALAGGESALSRFVVQVFQPVKPMLAEPGEDVDAAVKQLGEAALEFKLDGARIQVHKAGDEVRVYSRHLRDVTGAVPEVVELVRPLRARQLILDGEVIALRPDHRPHPFQITMQRFGRKLDVQRLREDLPLTPFFFDLLAADGEAVIDAPQARRFEALAGWVPASLIVPSLVTGDPSEAAAFLEAALAQGHEGLMAKSREAPYAAGSRGRSWLKVKSAHSLDLVVLAAEWGSGRRKGWLSNLHLGARDTERGGFVMLGKTFKGLTDEMLEWQTRRFLELEIGRDDYTVYVRPELVVEIAFNDVQASPQYPGRLALRFARVKRYRPDKPASEADTFEAVVQIYRRATGAEPASRS
ncbi:MAG TPA: ATP-dependent DNA ligase [Vicinamibacterales bacterium]|nr:ATP-dependent DNA ligase [Vicinamibacterales bacterium]